MRHTWKIGLAAAVLAVPALAVASKDAPARSSEIVRADATLLCSVGRLMSCTGASTCEPVAHGAVEAPRFLIIDLAERVISTTDPELADRTSEIRWLENHDDRLILQGTGNLRAWSLIISETTAELTAAVADDGMALMAGGDCIPYDVP